MRRNLRSFSKLLALLVIPMVYAEDSDCFQRSIFRALIERNGQFQARMNATATIHPNYHKRPHNYNYEEKFDFRSKSGEFEERRTSDGPELDRPSFRCLYLDGKEVYRFSDETRLCKSFALNQRTFKYELPRWGLNRIFNRSHVYSILGPSVLLEILYKNYDTDKERVKCEALEENQNEVGKNRRRCSITFNDTVRMNYSFVDRHDDEYTMYPEKIEGFEHVHGVWKSWAEISYLNFSALFTGEPIIDRDLPIGFGCRRVRSQNYPKVRTDYGNRFELEFGVELKYVAADGQSTEAAGKLKYLTRSYTGKMHSDLNNSINVVEAIDEITNASLRIFYNTRSHLMYQVNLEDNKCTTYNLTSNESINWFYLQDSFVKKPELYHADTGDSFLKSYSFLREYLLGDLPCLVFERKFDYWTDRSASSWENGTNLSKKAVTSRQNANKIVANDYLCSTHYYPKNSSYWSNDGRQFSVPKRIEFTIFNDPVYSHGAINFLAITIHSFQPNPEEYTKHNTSTCIDMDQ